MIGIDLRLKLSRSIEMILAASVLLAVSAGAAGHGNGEKPDVLVTGDSLIGRSLSTGETVLDLEGDVRFFDRKRKIFASGDRGNWRELVSRLRLSGRVAFLRNGEWMYGPVGIVDTGVERMTFPRGALLVSSLRTIAADKAVLHIAGDDEGGERAQFSGEVMVIDTSGVITADSLDLYADRGEAVARGGVSIELFAERYKVTGSRAVFDSTSIVVTGAPFLEELDSTGARTGVLEGDTVFIYPGEKRVAAVGSSSGDYRDVVTEAGRTVLEGNENTVTLLGHPRLDRKGETLEGESMRIRFAEGGDQIEEVRIAGDARVTSTSSDSGVVESSEAMGDTMVLRFREGDLYEMEAAGSATSFRTRADSTANERSESSAKGDTIRFFLDENELKEVQVAGGASGENVTAPLDATEEQFEEERVRYRGSRVVFRLDADRLSLSEKAHVEKGQTGLDADFIRYDLTRDLITALGKPSLQDAGEVVEGDRMVYNVAEGKGIIYNGVTAYESGTCRGERILRVGQNTLLIDHGRYTSCDLADPHYYFGARQMKIFLDDKSIVRPIVLHIVNIPVLALPFYLFPMKGNRSSGFILPQVEFGFSESKGRFLRNGGYFWAINDYTDLTFRGDFYENSRWIAYLDGRYRIRYLLNGSVRTSYQKSQGGSRRWSISAAHNQELGERTDLTMRANFVSDARFRVEQSTTLEDLNRTLKSDLTLKKRWESRSFTMDLKRTEQLDQEKITENLPSINYSQNQTEVFPPREARRGETVERRWFNDIYYRYTSRLLNSRKKQGGEWEKNFGWNHDLGLTFSQKLKGWLTLTSRADWKETWYDRDEIGQKWVRRGMGGASMSSNTNVYGTWFPGIGPLVGIRHIITPSVSFSIRPKNPNHFYKDADGNEQDRFNGTFGRSQRASRSLNLSLSNKLQTKLKRGETVVRNDQLILVTNRISRNFEKDDREWSDLTSTVRFQPVRPFSSDLSLIHDVYDWVNKRLSVKSSLRMSGELGKRPSGDDTESEGDEVPGDTETDAAAVAEEDRDPFEGETDHPYKSDDLSRRTGRTTSDVIPWDLSLSHSFSRSRGSSNFQQWLNTRVGLGLTRNWDLDYENRFDLESREIVSQGFKVHRDLHCWEASFRGRFSGREWEYYFNIRVKAHKEIFYEQGERRLGGF